MKEKLARLFKAYGELLSVIYEKAPIMVVLTFLAAIAIGLTAPFSIFVNSHIFNDALLVAQGNMTFAEYTPFIVLFILLAILPPLLNNVFVYGYVEPRSQLILRTSFRGRMLQKIKKMKYEHFESEASMEIIDKAYYGADNSARHMFPMYIVWTLSSIVASFGTLYFLFTVKWWLLLTVLIPFFLETYFSTKNNYNIYEEMDTYWNKERRYGILGGFLRSREFVKENKLFGSSDFLINTYKSRLNARNKEYEGFYLKNLKRQFLKGNITKLAMLANILILLVLFIDGQVNVGLFISLSLSIFEQLYSVLGGSTIFFRASGFHIKFFDYYNKYFDLSEDEQGDIADIPKEFSIEFRDVWFKYPQTEKDVLKGMSFKIHHGEKVSVVGENGEGKSTMIKLLLGLFTPDKGEILINDNPLSSYSASTKTAMFGTVFQDFVRYSISAKENIIIGDLEFEHDDKAFADAMDKGKANSVIDNLPEKENTILGRDFDGATDISGGQWQRIAIARAFMGNKPVLILDEPTSQLDPIAESNLYHEFFGMAKGKTSIFITHRLASTMITDKIFVISDGHITENGTHDELIKNDSLYAKMFESQKQWYKESEETQNA